MICAYTIAGAEEDCAGDYERCLKAPVPAATSGTQNSGAAASELFGTDLPAPATLSGFLNPGSGSYKDETGSLRYHRSPDQLEQDHKDWMSQFGYAARRTAFEKGDMTPYSAEARAKPDADFREAARRDGYEVPETVSAPSCGGHGVQFHR